MKFWIIALSLAQASVALSYDDLDQTFGNKKTTREIEIEYNEGLREANQGHSGAIVVDEFTEFERLEERPEISSVETSPAREGSSTFKSRTDSFLEEYFYHTHADSYSSNLKMREQRKFGLGALVGGSGGQFGATFELNFEDTNSAKVDFGAGDGYSAFQIVWKHTFEGDYLAPYISGGYARWYNSSGRGNYEGNDILKRILSESEKRNGQFAADFATASLGLQYNQLSGDFVGMSFYGEITAMYEVNTSVLVPNGSVGGLYYF